MGNSCVGGWYALNRDPCVLDGMAHVRVRARINPDGDARQPVDRQAGVGVSARGWLRENALDAQERAATQGFPPSRALRIRGIPWLSSEAASFPAPLPHPCRKVSRSNAVWRLNMS